METLVGIIKDGFSTSGTLALSRTCVHRKYVGEYEITPSVHDTTVFNTKNKLMTDDFTVKKVPYYATSNETGTTVYIGEEVE